MKTVTLYRPMSIERAMRDFDRYMGSFFGDGTCASAGKHYHQHHFRLPAMDIREGDDVYSVEMELPGFDEKNINVHVNGREIIVESKREESADEKTAENSGDKKSHFIVKERKASRFRRTFSLPENADYESISAKFKNGILSLDVKKRPETTKRTIQIETAS
jgi:HSP20 family protein